MIVYHRTWDSPHPGIADANAPSLQVPDERTKLIRKLRWIGLEDEAARLEHLVNGVAASDRGTVLAEPLSTD